MDPNKQYMTFAEGPVPGVAMAGPPQPPGFTVSPNQSAPPPYPTAGPGGYPAQVAGGPGGYPPTQMAGGPGGYPTQMAGGPGGYTNPMAGGPGGYPKTQQTGNYPPDVGMVDPSAGGQYAINDMPEDDGPNSWAGFSDKAIRRGFIRKVYGILMAQLLLTFGLTAVFMSVEQVRSYVRVSPGLYIAAYVIFIVVYITLICSTSLRRQWPGNFIVLMIFTLAMSYMVATISCQIDNDTVMLAFGITAVCCFAVTIFAFNTKYDLTSCAGVLFILIIVLLIFGFMMIFIRDQRMRAVYAAFGALVFMLFLAYDTQMIMGGKKYAISPEEHIFAAIQLYMDVVQIFLYILMLLGGGKK